MTITIPTVLGSPAAVSPPDARPARFGAQAGGFGAVFLSGPATPEKEGAPDGALVLPGPSTVETAAPGVSEPEAAETAADEAAVLLGADIAATAGPERLVASGGAAAEDRAPQRRERAGLSIGGPDTAAAVADIGLPKPDGAASVVPDSGNIARSQGIAEVATTQPAADGGAGALGPRGWETSTSEPPAGYALPPDGSNRSPVPARSERPDAAGATPPPHDVQAQARSLAEAAVSARSVQRPEAGIPAAAMAVQRTTPSEHSSRGGSTSVTGGEPRPLLSPMPVLAANDGVGFQNRAQGVGSAGPGVPSTGLAASPPTQVAPPAQVQQPLATEGGERPLGKHLGAGDPGRPPGPLPNAGESGPNQQSLLSMIPSGSGRAEGSPGAFGQWPQDPTISEARPRPDDRSAEPPRTPSSATGPSATGANVLRAPALAAHAPAQPQVPGDGAGIGTAAPTGDLFLPSDNEITEIRGGSEAFGTDRSSARQEVAAARGIETRSPIVQQITDVIGDPRDGAIEVELQPRELGRVRMSFAIADGSLSVFVSADRPDTLEAIRRNIDQLANDLRTFGYRSIEFDFAGSGAGGERGNWSDRGTQEAQPPIAADGATEVALPAQPTPPASTSLDLRL